MQQQEADVILFVSFGWILLDIWCISEFMYTQIHINHSRGIFTPQFLSELPKVETNIFHFSCAINACDREANWPMALEILGSMGRHKARISMWHVQILVYSIFFRDTWVQSFMLEIFSETWEHVFMYGVTLTLPWRGSCLNPSNSHRQVQANAVSYSSTLSACRKSSEWPRALWLLQSMTDQLLGCSNQLDWAATSNRIGLFNP